MNFSRRYARNAGALAGAALLLLVIAAALAAPLVYPADPLRIVGRAQLWPFADPRFPLGTDSLGRDMAALLMHGARTTLVIGLAASLTAIVIGVTIGAFSGFYGGLLDQALMRATELFQTIPALILVLTIITIVGPELIHVVLTIGLVSWPAIARVTRAEFLTLRDRDFVEACRAMGMGNPRLILRQILPNAITPVIALATLSVAGAILFESTLSFLGLSDPSISTWGRLIGEGRSFVRTSWYICAIPGAAILLTVYALNLIADGVSDALDPRAGNRAGVPGT